MPRRTRQRDRVMVVHKSLKRNSRLVQSRFEAVFLVNSHLRNNAFRLAFLIAAINIVGPEFALTQQQIGESERVFWKSPVVPTIRSLNSITPRRQAIHKDNHGLSGWAHIGQFSIIETKPFPRLILP